MFTPKKNSSNKNIDDLSVVAEFLIEDFRFTRSYLSIMDKLFLEERKRYESAYNFHANKVEILCMNVSVIMSLYYAVILKRCTRTNIMHQVRLLVYVALQSL